MNANKLFCFVLILLIPLQEIYAQRPDSVKVFLDSALNIMEKNSIYSKQVNWKSIRAESFKMAKNAKNYTETNSALQYAFNTLNDKHGWLVFDDTEYRNPKFKPDTSRITADIKRAASRGARIYCGVIDDHYAYISIPFFGGQSGATMNSFAQKIQDSLCKVITPKTKGIIVDLRLNAGGNLFPMMIGLANVLGDGVVSESKDVHGKTISVTELKNGSITLLDTIIVRLKNSCGDLSALPTAVIIGPVTGSAGECLAVALRGRKKTILVGENTAGYTSSNQGYLLPGVNNGIVIGVDVLHDRNGKKYPENVKPDIIVIGGDSFFDRKHDKKIAAAIRWLQKQKN